jgi:hypothetical protein
MAGVSSSALVSLLSQILSGVTSSTTTAPGTTSLASWLANQFSKNHSMVTTVDGLLDQVLSNAGNAGAITAIANDILTVPNLPPKLDALVNQFAAAAANPQQLGTLVSLVRSEVAT